MKYDFECKYCGKTWSLSWCPRNLECSVCKDKNIKVKSHKKGNFFGYEDEENEHYSYDDTIKWGSD